MRYLESFYDRTPIDNDVIMWEEYLSKNYSNFSDTNFGKMIAIDDKSYFLKNKSDITNRIFFDIKNSTNLKIHEPSLRRAIKNWIDKNQ